MLGVNVCRARTDDASHEEAFVARESSGLLPVVCWLRHGLTAHEYGPRFARRREGTAMATTSRTAAIALPLPPGEVDAPVSPRSDRAGVLARWRYAGGARDLRLDFLRGLAVIAMVADHLGGEPSWLYALTGGNHFLFSAAEAFVFISGLVMGVVYARVIATYGIADAIWKAFRRAGTLYFLTVTLGFGFATLSYWTNMPWVDGVRVLDPMGRIIERVTLHRAFYLTDVLLMYTLLVAVAPFVFLLLHRGHTLPVLIGSWLMWGVYQVWPEQMLLPWRIEDNSVFQFAAWQALFFTGVALGYHRNRVITLARRLPVALPLMALVALCAGSVLLYNFHGSLLAPFTADGDTTGLMNEFFGKADLRVGRLLVFAAFFVVLFTLTTLVWKPLHRVLGWLLMPLGQHALFAYSVHLGVIIACTKLVSGTSALQSNTPLVNTVVQLAGIFAVWGIVRAVPVMQTVAARLWGVVVLSHAEQRPVAAVRAGSMQQQGQ